MSFIGDAIGGIFGGGGGGGGSNQPTSYQTVTNPLPDWLSDTWEGTIIPKAKELYEEGPREYFPGDTVTPFSQQTEMGMAQLEGFG